LTAFQKIGIEISFLVLRAKLYVKKCIFIAGPERDSKRTLLSDNFMAKAIPVAFHRNIKYLFKICIITNAGVEEENKALHSEL